MSAQASKWDSYSYSDPGLNTWSHPNNYSSQTSSASPVNKHYGKCTHIYKYCSADPEAGLPDNDQECKAPPTRDFVTACVMYTTFLYVSLEGMGILCSLFMKEDSPSWATVPALSGSAWGCLFFGFMVTLMAAFAKELHSHRALGLIFVLLIGGVYGLMRFGAHLQESYPDGTKYGASPKNGTLA